MTTLYFVRHGQTDWNLQRRLQGHTDVPLNQTGREQAQALSAFFRENQIRTCVTSDLSRAIQTAALMAPDAILTTDWRLREADLGLAEGLTYDEVVSRFGQNAWENFLSVETSDGRPCFPGGEAKGQHRARLMEALRSFLSRRTETQAAAVVTHGGSLVRLLDACNPGWFQRNGRLPRVGNGEIFRGTAKLDLKTMALELRIDPEPISAQAKDS
jgi:broad specificity phosphatase PhoE